MFKATLWLPASVVILLFTSTPTQADSAQLLDETGLVHCSCPVCDHTCKLKVEPTENEKTCFEVESKVICIPRVVFPWQKSKKVACASCTACDGMGCTDCVHSGARLRRVCVLKPKKYTCPACKYTWKAEKLATCCDESCCDDVATSDQAANQQATRMRSTAPMTMETPRSSNTDRTDSVLVHPATDHAVIWSAPPPWNERSAPGGTNRQMTNSIGLQPPAALSGAAALIE